MAAKSLTAGELYFVGEKDPMKNEDTQFVKIGIVRDNGTRSTVDRLGNHQTSNPRLLHAVSIIKTPIVERVETTLHGMFASMRLSGEWFFFTEDERTRAIEVANELARDAQAHESQMLRAAELKDVQSNGEQIYPTDAVLSLHQQLVGLRADIKECKAMTKDIVGVLGDASKRGLDLGRILSIQEKKGVDRFNEATFKIQHQDLWAQFMRIETKMTGSFRLIDTVATRPDPYSIYPELKELKARIDGALGVSDSELSQLHAMFLEVLTFQSPAEWKVMLLEDELKSECGTSPGIAGVCNWAREESTKKFIDKSALKAAHPDLFAEFVTVGEPSTAVVAARDRGFQI